MQRRSGSSCARVLSSTSIAAGRCRFLSNLNPQHLNPQLLNPKPQLQTSAPNLQPSIFNTSTLHSFISTPNSQPSILHANPYALKRTTARTGSLTKRSNLPSSSFPATKDKRYTHTHTHTHTHAHTHTHTHTHMHAWAVFIPAASHHHPRSPRQFFG